jgi:hypothetical protein
MSKFVPVAKKSEIPDQWSNSHKGTKRDTGITQYLKNGGKLEHAQQIAAHESPRTTKLYDRREDEVTLDGVERIVF